MKPILFKPLSQNDMTLLYDWFQEPTIKQWYARGTSWSFENINQKYLPRVQGKDNIPSFIIYEDERSIGFIQYYWLTEHYPEGIRDNNHLLFNAYQPNEMVGIDLFLADKNNRGRGLGTRILNDFIRDLPRNVRAILVDPDATNHQAIRCYEKAGFKRTDYSEDENYLLLLNIRPVKQ